MTTPAKEPAHPVTFTTIDMSAEAKKVWGAQWDAPEIEYEFAKGKRIFKRRTGDAAIYASSPDFG